MLKSILMLAVGLLGSLALVSCESIDQLLMPPDQRYDLVHQTCLNCRDDKSGGEVCLVCHSDYTKNHHPIDFTPPEISLVRIDQEKFPLFDGKVQCFTCHTTERKYVTPQDKLLRGGPYPDNRQLCFKCHYQEKYAQIDVHRMFDESGAYRTVEGKLICTFCHPQDINNLYTTDTVRFKADITFLCFRCHPAMSDPHIRMHFSMVPSDKVKVKMRQFETENGIILPLVPKGRVTCATCHNPHQAGVIVNPPAMAGADSLHRLRLDKFHLCLGCHL